MGSSEKLTERGLDAMVFGREIYLLIRCDPNSLLTSYESVMSTIKGKVHVLRNNDARLPKGVQ